MKQRETTTTGEVPAGPVTTAPLSPITQAVISVLLLIHMLAVFVPPMMFASGANGEASPAVRPFYVALQPYVDLLYLNHGYFFFAPDPGPNHLVRFELDFDDGREPVVGEFPNIQSEWPRLLYHRHFMLSEQLHNLYQPPQPQPQPQKPVEESRRAEREYRRERASWDLAFATWKQRRSVYDALRNSIEEHLKNEYGAQSVLLIRREHRPLDPFEILEDRLQPQDDETYRNLPEQSLPLVPRAEVLPWNPAPSR